jgi:hypothetical protein
VPTAVVDVRLTIVPDGDGYAVQVAPAAGVAYARERLTLPAEVTVGGVQAALSREFPARDGRPVACGPPNGVAELTPEAFGLALGRAVFHGAVRDVLRDATGPGRVACVRLLIDAPRLAALPWELLQFPSREGGTLLALSPQTPLARVTRHAPAAGSQARPSTGPLRVLAVAASPSNLPPLDVNGEAAALREIFEATEIKGRVALEWCEADDLDGLQTRLQSGRYAVFHFAGHGDFDPATGRGEIVLCDARGDARPLGGGELALLFQQSGVRLAVLNSCKGASSAAANAFASAAERLATVGVGAVVAMQYAITDEAANQFARRFYGELAAGRPIESAMVQARIQLKTARHGGHEWATPVLYLNADPGVPLVPPPPRATRPYSAKTVGVVAAIGLGVAAVYRLATAGLAPDTPGTDAGRVAPSPDAATPDASPDPAVARALALNPWREVPGSGVWQLQTHEVSVAEVRLHAEADGRAPCGVEGAPTEPVTGCLLADARAYCRWIGGELPTPEVWRMAARDVHRPNFPASDRAPLADNPGAVNRSRADVGWDVTSTGIVDLVGNRYEWVDTQDGLPQMLGASFHTPRALLDDHVRDPAPVEGPNVVDVSFRCARRGPR